MRKGQEKRATIRDVARLSGVSVGTVSRSINAPDSVRPGTLRQGQRGDPRRSASSPTAARRTCAAAARMTVGFVVDDIANPLHAVTFKAADAEMREHGFSLYLVNTNGRAREEADAIDMLQRGRADGVIMTINSEQDARTVKRIEGAAHPLGAARPRPAVRDGLRSSPTTPPACGRRRPI